MSAVETQVPRLPCYVLSDDALAMGASLGNSALWVTTRGTGAIERIFHTGFGESLFGAVSIRYGLATQPLRSALTSAGHATAEQAFVPLRAERAGTFEIHPAYQRHRFTIAGTVDVSETTFVPLGEVMERPDEPVVFQLVELRNNGRTAKRLRVAGFARFRGTLTPDVSAHYDASVNALIAVGSGHPNAVRCYGLSRPATKYATTIDFGRVYDPTHLHPLHNDTLEGGDILGNLQLDIELQPGEIASFAFSCALYDAPVATALREYRGLPAPDDALARTIRYLERTLSIAEVLTPNRHINEGALWSKVNMRRVMARYSHGPAFTNEPGASSNIVGRDAAWFVYGNDHFMPAFSRALLEKFADVQYADGKIPEYYNAVDGQVEDDGLNINDDTPLFILAVNHHVRATGDTAWLAKMYASVSRAANYIVSQMDDRNLVFCTARDTRGDVWGIASWRNVIAGYTINGAVTEINAECAAALRAAAHLAESAGAKASETDDFRSASERIRYAMDDHLRNPDNGLYYLNIDVDGNIHTDVTADQIFPVMFRVCDEETGFRIISRLNAGDFWTPAGLRTISRDDPLYEPSRNIGLLGGVWPGLTWWYAFSAARYHPEFMVRALSASFQHYAVNPKQNHTVPGQFGEYFDGESLINRGMRLSPWEPPRFLWAAVEGVCGLMLTNESPRINPLIPLAWKWIALKRLPYHGSELTYFAVRTRDGVRIYTTADIETKWPSERFDEDVSPGVEIFSETAAVVALRRTDTIVLFVGNVGTQTQTVHLNMMSLLDLKSIYDVRIYNSERDAWDSGELQSGQDFGAVAVMVDTGGYCVIELSVRRA